MALGLYPRAGREAELAQTVKPHALYLTARTHVHNDPLQTVPEFGVKYSSTRASRGHFTPKGQHVIMIFKLKSSVTV